MLEFFLNFFEIFWPNIMAEKLLHGFFSTHLRFFLHRSLQMMLDFLGMEKEREGGKPLRPVLLSSSSLLKKKKNTDFKTFVPSFYTLNDEDDDGDGEGGGETRMHFVLLSLSCFPFKRHEKEKEKRDTPFILKGVGERREEEDLSLLHLCVCVCLLLFFWEAHFLRSYH